MLRRPLLLLWIGLMLALWICRTAGLPVFGEPALSGSDREALESGVTAEVTGTVSSRSIRENSTAYVLKDAVIRYDGGQICISRLLLTAVNTASASSSFRDSPGESISFETTAYSGNGTGTSLQIGSVVRFRGKCSFPEPPGNPGQFDFRQYYACRRIYVQALLLLGTSPEVLAPGGGAGEFLCALRESLMEQLAGTMSPEGAGLAGALLLGDRSLLGTEIRANLQAASVYHVISISGMHIMLMGQMVYRFLSDLLLRVFALLRPDFRRRHGSGLRRGAAAAAALTAAAVMGLYCIFAGSPVSALRAYIMFAVSLGAGVSGRSYDSLSALSLAGILLLAGNPGWLFWSGYQLSAGAVLSMAVLYPRLTGLVPEAFWKEGSPRKQILEKLLQAVFVWLAVTLGMLPLTAWYFYEIPLLGLPVNLCVVPFLGAAMAAGAAGMTAGAFWLPAGRVVLLPLDTAARLLVFLAEKIRHLSWGTWVCGQPELWQAVIWYAALGAACFILYRTENGTDRQEKRCLPGKMSALAFLAAGCFFLFLRIPDPFSLTVLDVGQGDSLVLSVSNGRPFAREEVFLSDGGSSDVREAGAYRIMPYLSQRGIRRVEGIFVSHADEDHINGLEELLLAVSRKETSLRVGRLLIPAWMREDPAAERLLLLAAQADVPVVSLTAGDSVRLTGGREETEIRVLHPLPGGAAQSGNAGSLVLHVRYGRFSALLTGDLEGEGEQELLRDLPDTDCLKVAHHGSEFSTGERFLDRNAPETALISCGAGNRYGHPHARLLDRLRKRGIDVYRTDTQGALTVISDGRRYTIRTFREG